MRNRFQINPDISETGFGFSGFLHSIGETETGFAKPSRDGFSDETENGRRVYVELFVVIVAEITTKSNIHIFHVNYIKVLDRCTGNYERGTFLTLATSLYYFITKLGVSCRHSNGWVAVLCIRFAH